MFSPLKDTYQKKKKKQRTSVYCSYTFNALRWQCLAPASSMYCTISRLREAVSFNQVPYPAGTVSASSFCRRPPPWSRLLLALAPGSSLTLPHSPGAPPLQDAESAGEWQASGGKNSGWAPQTHKQGHFCRSHTRWPHIGLTGGKTHLTWDKLLPVAIARLLLFQWFHNFETKSFLLCDRSARKRPEHYSHFITCAVILTWHTSLSQVLNI